MIPSVKLKFIYIYIYIYVCMCVCVYIYVYIYILFIYIKICTFHVSALEEKLHDWYLGDALIAYLLLGTPW